MRLLASLAVAAGTGVACDATVALDTTRPTYTRLLTAGACEAEPDLSVFNLSVLLLDRNRFILPDDRLRNERESVGDLLDEDDFSFACPVERASCGDGNAAAQGEGEPTEQPADVQVESVEFQWSGGEERKNDQRLVMIMMDNSVSLVGGDPQSPNIDPAKATDPRDERITFFRELINDLPASENKAQGEVPHYVSIMKFDRLPDIDPDCAVPSLSRDVNIDCMTAYDRGEDGPTNLWDALDAGYRTILSANTDLNPVVILFTDGTENGDNSGASMEQAIQPYVDNGIPILIVQLQPPRLAGDERQGRTAELVDLACNTGGQHFFLERASEFSARRDLRVILRNRITGRWNLRVRSTLNGNNRFPPDNAYFLSTELSGTLADITRAVEMSRSTDTLIDDRLWFNK